MTEAIWIAQSNHSLGLLPSMANRHGLITGATGTGKTVTLRLLAEGFSRLGVPVFLADIKGDLSGLAQAGSPHPKIQERLNLLDLKELPFQGFPVTFWDLYGEQGHPLRTTLCELGPLLLGRLLNLNETQAGVLNLVFRVADDQGLPILDLKDLRSLLHYAGEHAQEFKLQYGNLSAASIGAIQRGLLALESQGCDRFFGEPALDLDDLLQTDERGQGVINILAADRLIQAPKLYATFLMWLLAELFERLPEVGDLDQPKLVFFFDEAHLLFSDAPPSLLEKIEQMVRLIRSKGVGVYFVTQNPLDVPEKVLGQLGNRIQHALRAFTPRDQKAVRTAAETFRSNPELDVAQAITQLAVGEALVSFLDEKGIPVPVERAWILPPLSQIPPLQPLERKQILNTSLLKGVYDQAVDRDSAFEILDRRTQEAMAQNIQQKTSRDEQQSQSKASSRSDSLLESMAKSTLRSAGSAIGREIVRGLVGSLFGGGGRRKSSW